MSQLKNHSEVFAWISCFIVLYFVNTSENHISLCLLKNLGFTSCPGCGIGHSMHYLLHGDIERSLQAHVLGIPACIILVIRILNLMKITKIKYV